MIAITYFISTLLLITTILASPISEKSPELTTDLPVYTTAETAKPKSRQLLLAYLDPSAMSSPLRTKEEVVEDEKDLNSHVEIFHEDAEIMQPAENIIFRPLFSYKVALAKRNNRNNQRRISNARAESATKKPIIEQNTIKRRSDVYSYRPEEIPYYPYRPYYYYEGRFYPYD